MQTKPMPSNKPNNSNLILRLIRRMAFSHHFLITHKIELYFSLQKKHKKRYPSTSPKLHKNPTINLILRVKGEVQDGRFFVVIRFL